MEKTVYSRKNKLIHPKINVSILYEDYGLSSITEKPEVGENKEQCVIGKMPEKDSKFEQKSLHVGKKWKLYS